MFESVGYFGEGRTFSTAGKQKESDVRLATQRVSNSACLLHFLGGALQHTGKETYSVSPECFFYYMSLFGPEPKLVFYLLFDQDWISFEVRLLMPDFSHAENSLSSGIFFQVIPLFTLSQRFRALLFIIILLLCP